MTLIYELEELRDKARSLAEKLRKTNEEISFINSSLRNLVSFSRKGDTFTLEYEGRKLKLTKGKFGRYKIKENGKVIDRESMRSMNDIRLDLALGRI